MTKLSPIEIKRKSGTEKFCDQERSLDFDLLGFWQWSSSDIVSKATRGVLAEYIVAQALGVADDHIREEWAAYDLKTVSGIKVEVKSAAFIQSWHQDRYSKISFRVPKTMEWTKDINHQSQEAKRQADVYVFALLAELDQRKLNPLDVSQWEFFVLPTSVLDNRSRSQHSITLPSLKKLVDSVSFFDLKNQIERAFREDKIPG